MTITASPSDPATGAGRGAGSAPLKRAHPAKRALAHWSRVLHTYLSMVSFSILLFFAVTGLTLNHQEALIGLPKTARLTGHMDAALVGPQAGAAPARDPIVAGLRNAHRLKADLSDFRADADQISVSFKGPGYEADAFIDRQTGAYELNESRFGVVAIVNDLHKGRDTGKAWAGIIDVSAGLMVLVSLTGLVLIFFLHKRLMTGLVSLVFGTLVCVLVYLFLVS